MKLGKVPCQSSSNTEFSLTRQIVSISSASKIAELSLSSSSEEEEEKEEEEEEEEQEG